MSSYSTGVLFTYVIILNWFLFTYVIILQLVLIYICHHTQLVLIYICPSYSTGSYLHNLCHPILNSPLHWSSSPHLLVSSFCPQPPALVILPFISSYLPSVHSPLHWSPPFISSGLPSVHSPLHWSSFPHLLVSSFCPQPPALVVLPSSPRVFLLSTAPCTGHPPLISSCLPSVHSPLHWSSSPHLLVSSFCPQPPALVILPSSPRIFLLSTAPCTGRPSLISSCLSSVLVILPSYPRVFLLSTAPCTGHPPLISSCLSSVHSPLHWSSSPHLLVSSLCPQPPALVVLPSSPRVFLLSTAPCTSHLPSHPPALIILPSSPRVFLLYTAPCTSHPPLPAPCTGHPPLISSCLPSVHSPLHWSSSPHLLVSFFGPQPPALVILPSSPRVFLLSTAPCTGHPPLISSCLPSVHSPLHWSSSPPSPLHWSSSPCPVVLSTSFLSCFHLIILNYIFTFSRVGAALSSGGCFGQVSR